MEDSTPAPLLHPVALASVGVLLTNDHVLKDAYPGVLTGKLSDFAGLLFFPLLVHALWTLALPTEDAQTNRMRLLVSATATGVVFAAVQLLPPAGEAYAWLLGALQWPARAIAFGADVPLVPARHTADPTDLIALPMIAVAILIARSMRR